MSEYIKGFNGLRFYNQQTVVSDVLMGKSVIKNILGSEIKFKFYKNNYIDIVYKRGKIKKQTFVGYSIECEFGHNFPSEMKAYNNIKMVIRKSLLNILDEKIIFHLLLNFYTKFLILELKKRKNEDSKL